MLVYIIIMLLVLITLYFTTKEGMTTPRVTSTALVTDNNPLPSNAAVYNTPIQTMDKITSILEGTTTESDILHAKLDRQNQEISEFNKSLAGKSSAIVKLISDKDEEIGLSKSNVSERQRKIDEYNTIKIPNATALKELCDMNGPTNTLKNAQPSIPDILNYIDLLDTVYVKLRTINTELITTDNEYNLQTTSTHFVKISSNFISFPTSMLSDTYTRPAYKI